MVSLYKRAGKHQRRILRIIEGAVKNTADHHPEMEYSPRMARSIAKRAAGTLSAQWPRELAEDGVPIPVSQFQEDIGPPLGPSGSDLAKAPKSGQGNTVALHARVKRGGAQGNKPHPSIRRIVKRLSTQVGEYKRSRDPFKLLRADGIIEALRVITSEVPLK